MKVFSNKKLAKKPKTLYKEKIDGHDVEIVALTVEEDIALKNEIAKFADNVNDNRYSLMLALLKHRLRIDGKKLSTEEVNALDDEFKSYIAEKITEIEGKAKKK